MIQYEEIKDSGDFVTVMCDVAEMLVVSQSDLTLEQQGMWMHAVIPVSAISLREVIKALAPLEDVVNDISFDACDCRVRVHVMKRFFI